MSWAFWPYSVNFENFVFDENLTVTATDEGVRALLTIIFLAD
jgi:hypothetical protein